MTQGLAKYKYRDKTKIQQSYVSSSGYKTLMIESEINVNTKYSHMLCMTQLVFDSSVQKN